MHIFLMGGFMMWPLALVSLMVAAIVIERLLFFAGCGFPGRNFEACLGEALEGRLGPLLERVEKTPALELFGRMLQNPDEGALRIEGEAVVERLERYLPTLGILSRLAPLMGLLGTVLGMIAAFSEISGASSGLDMAQLARGIWQALITTAAGLAIAIPGLFFLHEFEARVDRIARALSQTANVALLRARKSGHA